MVADWGFVALDVRGRSEREGEWLGRMGDGAMIWRGEMNELRKRCAGLHPPSQGACTRKMVL
jgi:hypothetical protein